MEKSVNIVRLDIDEFDELSGVDAIALVEEPAIEADFIYFSKNQKEVFESYRDYPDSVSNNAKRGIELNEKVGNKCATQVGKVRAQQLAQKEPISVETIKRMYSYLSRAEEYYDENDTEACGTISYLLWGGLAGKRWSESKLKELGLFEGNIRTDMPDYNNEPSGSLITKYSSCGCGEEHMAEIGPRGGVKKSPKAPKSDTPGEGKRGSDKNKPGAAGTTRGKIKIPKRVEESLQKKSDDFNERYKEKLGYGVNIGMLKAVYQRGVGAYQTSHSPDVKSAEQWGQARVNAFLYLVKNGRPQNKKYTTDYDLLPTKHPKRVENSSEKFVDPRAGETEDEFISRCIPVLISEGYDEEQSAAICYSTWRDRFDENERQIDLYISELFDLLGYLDGLPVFSTPEEASEVAEIAGCEGYHEHKMGDFIVYMPCESHEPEWDEVLQEAYEEWIKSRQMSWSDLNEEELDGILDYLDSVAQDDVMFSQDTFNNVNTSGITQGQPNNSTSFLDTPTTKIRYKYDVKAGKGSGVQSNTRDFCRILMTRYTDQGKVFRKEDINNMSIRGVNEGFGPGGVNQYNIFLYAGGTHCRHEWKQVLYKKNSKGVWVDSSFVVESPIDTQSTNVTLDILGNVVTPEQLGFAKEDGDKQILAGPLMIPNKLIYRYDPQKGEYYVYFSEDTIQKIAYKYMEKKYTDMTNIEHSQNMKLDDVFVVESWLVSDPEKDKSMIYSNGEKYPKGTWYGVMKVKNKEIWDNYVKTGLVKGFSVEGFFVDELLNNTSNK